MTNAYENCPVFESDDYLLRLSSLEDATDLAEISQRLNQRKKPSVWRR